MTSKQIFLTGGSGLVGSELRKVLSASFFIKAVSRSPQPPSANVSWINFDATKPGDTLDELLGGSEVVVHNAACLKAGNTRAEIEEIQAVNVSFTRRLLRSASSTGVKKIVFTSGLNTLRKPLDNIIKEEHELNPLTEYARTKFIAEELIKEYAYKYGLSYSILRLSSPVSLLFETMPETVVRKWINQSRNKQTLQVYGGGMRSQDFVAVSDVASAFLACINKEYQNGIYNIASGNMLSMLDLAKLITDKFGNKYELIGKDENENDRWNISIGKARAELGYDPKFTSRSIISALLEEVTA